ncbi:hypothetical protein LG202_04490 [Methylobacillus methanolivorans]
METIPGRKATATRIIATITKVTGTREATGLVEAREEAAEDMDITRRRSYQKG